MLVVHMPIGIKLAFKSLDSEYIGDGVKRIIIMNHYYYCARQIS